METATGLGVRTLLARSAAGAALCELVGKPQQALNPPLGSLRLFHRLCPCLLAQATEKAGM